MDFEFFGSGQHAVSAEGAAGMVGRKDVFFLDVRTREEDACVRFPFAVNIPVNELPDRMAELPDDRTIVIICSTIFRSAVVWAYLRSRGFERVKGLAGTTEQMAAAFKPGPLYKTARNVQPS